jgi:sodium/hydrogen antiporter
VIRVLTSRQIIVENEDGDVVKTYELPSQKPEGDRVSQSLKYMGMGGLVRSGDRTTAAAGSSAEGDPSATPRPGMPSWASGVIRRTAGGLDPAQRARKKSVVEEQEEEDDRHIRFTIGGVGRRMTKENFIEEMQKLPKSTRREVVDQSDASNRVKTLAKEDPPATQPEVTAESSAQAVPASPTAQATWRETKVDNAEDTSSGEQNSGSSSRSDSPSGGKALDLDSSSRDAPETAVERRRRLAVLQGVDGPEQDVSETAAERRRREAALGMSSATGAEEDSDDDDTPRVPPPKRGIRFAEPEKTRE